MEESKETILELIEGYNSSLPAEGKVHHICFKVDSLKEEIKRLKKHGVTFLLGEEIETLRMEHVTYSLRVLMGNGLSF